MPSYSAVLLAGGHSRRMGRDKALLSVPGSKLLIWQRQLQTLEELHPEEIFWSGPRRPGLPEHLHVISDEVKNAGPLAGISACLNLLQSDLAVVLAIDLPLMTASFLQGLLGHCSTSCGAVGRTNNYFEPLAAIYPQGLRVLAREHLKKGKFSMQDLIQEARRLEMLQAISLKKKDVLLFKNLNSPDDLQDRI